jgi:hypothetical protein
VLTVALHAATKVALQAPSSSAAAAKRIQVS